MVGHLKLNASMQSDLCGILQVKIGSRSVGGPSGPGSGIEYELTRRTDALSPKLLKAAAQGTLFPSATILVYKPGTTVVAKSYKLSNAAISSLKLGLGLEQPIETLTLIAAPKKGV